MSIKIGNTSIGNIYFNDSVISKIYSGSDLIYQSEIPNYLCFTANTAGSTVELIVLNRPSIANTAYSRDGKTWITFTPSTTQGDNVVTLTNVGDKVYFRNDITGNFSTSSAFMSFKMTGSIAASGNVNSMYSSTNFESLTDLIYECCYSYLFQGCSALTSAPELPATTLTNSCYYNMFSACTKLTSAPALPATTLAEYCYCAMFEYCSSLYVSDTSGTDYNKQWNIPTSGTFTNTTTYNQSNMFYRCSGTRSSNAMSGAAGESHTYYTQNTPIA